MSAIRLMWFKLYRPAEFYAVYFTVRGDDIDYEAAVGGAAVARAHMEAVKRRLKEEKNAKDEDVLVSLQLVNEMLSRGYAFLPIELGKSRGNKYIVEDGKVRLPFCALKGVGGTAAASLERCHHRRAGVYLRGGAPAGHRCDQCRAGKPAHRRCAGRPARKQPGELLLTP